MDRQFWNTSCFSTTYRTKRTFESNMHYRNVNAPLRKVHLKYANYNVNLKNGWMISMLTPFPQLVSSLKTGGDFVWLPSVTCPMRLRHFMAPLNQNHRTTVIQWEKLQVYYLYLPFAWLFSHFTIHRILRLFSFQVFWSMNRPLPSKKRSRSI